MLILYRYDNLAYTFAGGSATAARPELGAGAHPQRGGPQNCLGRQHADIEWYRLMGATSISFWGTANNVVSSGLTVNGAGTRLSN